MMNARRQASQDVRHVRGDRRRYRRFADQTARRTLSGKFSGARVTLATGIGLIASSLGVTAFMHPARDGIFRWFLAIFLLMFTLTGLLNGLTFRTIGVIQQFDYRTQGLFSD